MKTCSWKGIYANKGILKWEHTSVNYFLISSQKMWGFLIEPYNNLGWKGPPEVILSNTLPEQGQLQS